MASKRKNRRRKRRPSRQQDAAGTNGPTPVSPAEDQGAEGGAGATSSFRGWALSSLVAALLVGLACAVYLTRLHLHLTYGNEALEALCDFGSGFNCSAVNRSEQSELFGAVPVALLAVPVYAWMLVLVALGWVRRDQRSLGAVAVLGLLATLYSAYLAYVSAVVIGDFCLFCVAMYVVNLSALLLPGVASRKSLLEMIRHGLQAATDLRVAAVSALTLAVVAGIAWGGYANARDSLVADFGKELRAQAPPAGKENPGKDARPQPKNARSAAKQPVRRAQERFEVPIDDTVPFKGPADAAVTIILYDDFQCPFCRRLVSPMEQLLELYPRDVRIGFRHFPMHSDCNGAVSRDMHPDACRAARSAECARQQGLFWPYYRELFHNARDLSADALTSYAHEVGLDVEALTACMSSPATLDKVEADARTGGALHVTGTPTFFVNGRRFSGALPIQMLKAIVEAELAGQEKTIRELREAPKLPDVIGEVDAPEMVRLVGPFGPFEIDTVEASIRNGKAMSVPGVPAATNLDWFEARAACQAAGKRLCTEAEWMTACQGAIPVDANHNGIYSDYRLAGTEYPYGNLYKAGLCNDDLDVPAPAPGSDATGVPLPSLITGNHPKCRSSSGVYDLSGNVREWIGTVPNMGAYIGGAFQSQASATCYSRTESYGPYHRSDALGFRCCRGGVTNEKVTHPGRQVGQKLAPFTAQIFDGGTFDSRSLEGKVALITFWASWCRVCRQELPAYAEIYPQLKEKGVEILAVNTDKDPARIEQFLREVPLPFTVLIDSDSHLYRSFDAGSMPTSYLVDPQGRIRTRRKGYRKGDERRLVEAVEEILSQQ